MERHHRRALNRCMNDLTENLVPSDVFSYLIAREIMSFDDIERINHQNSTQRKVFLFVPLLQRKGPNAFKEFVGALEERSTYKHLVDKLQEEADYLIRQESDDIDVESSVMRRYHKTTLRTCAVDLYENLDVDDVMSHMITKEIMTHYDREKFDKLLTRSDKVEEFLSTLLRKGGNAFDVFVEALAKDRFYDGLASKLTKLNKSHKAVYDEYFEELVNETKDGESHDFTSLKESVADCLGRRDAFCLCEHFNLDENSITQSKHPALSVVTLLCKENILLEDNRHNFLRALEVLPLHDVKSIVKAYNTERENGVEIRIMIVPQVNPPTKKGNDVIRRVAAKLRNKLRAFNTGERLRILFQRQYGIRYERLEEGSIILRLVILTTTALQKLISDIEDGTVAKLLLPALFPEEDVKIIQTDSPTSKVTLEVSLEQLCYNDAMNQLGLYESEKEEAKEYTCGDIDRREFESFVEKIGIRSVSPRNMNLRDPCVESPIPTPCDTFLSNVPQLCLRSGFSDKMTGERYNMRDFIYTILINSETSERCEIITKINSSNMAVPILLSGIAGSKPKLLQWVPSIIDKTGKEEDESCSSFLSDFIVSVVRIGETRLSKSSFLNTLYQFTQKRAVPSAFLINDKTFPRPSFSQGCVEIVTAPSHGTGCFHGVISFLNLRGDCTKFEAQRKFLIRVSDLIIALIDESSVPDHKFAIDKIKTQSQNAIIVEVKQSDSCPAHEKNYPLDRRQESIVVDVLQLDVLCEEIHKEIIKCGEECKTKGQLKHDLVSGFCKTIEIIVEEELSKHYPYIINDQSMQPLEVQQREEQRENISVKEHALIVALEAYLNEKNNDYGFQVKGIVKALLKLPPIPFQKMYEAELTPLENIIDFLEVRDEYEQNITTVDYVRAVREAIKGEDFRFVVHYILHEKAKAMQKIYQNQNFIHQS